MAEWIALGLSAILAVNSAVQQEKAQDQRKEAQEIQQRQQASETARAKRRQRREALIREGELRNIQAQQGGAGSSAVSAATGSLSSQLGTNLSFLDQSFQRSTARSERLQNAADLTGEARTSSQLASAVGTFGPTIAGGAQSIFDTEFDPLSNPPSKIRR